jgi:hypothetical protein
VQNIVGEEKELARSLGKLEKEFEKFEEVGVICYNVLYCVI